MRNRDRDRACRDASTRSSYGTYHGSQRLMRRNVHFRISHEQRATRREDARRRNELQVTAIFSLFCRAEKPSCFVFNAARKGGRRFWYEAASFRVRIHKFFLSFFERNAFIDITEEEISVKFQLESPDDVFKLGFLKARWSINIVDSAIFLDEVILKSRIIEFFYLVSISYILRKALFVSDMNPFIIKCSVVGLNIS